jgi:formimidoylglutamate deiminase
MTDDERRGAARRGAVAGLCPTTEANLGDGLFDLPAWLEAGGRWGVGSDSQVCVNAAEELLLLEYGQRLRRARRNVAAREDAAWTATAMTLDAVAGGAQAGGRAGLAGLVEGARADLVVLDAADPLLSGLTPAGMLAAHVFASHRRSAIADVLAGGVRRVAGGRHPLRDEAAAAFVVARARLIEGESDGPAALAGRGPTG